MRIGFDAKRAFANKTGLGNYSRTLLKSLADQFPDNDYYLYTPATSDLFGQEKFKIRTANSSNSLYKNYWRSRLIAKEAVNDGIQVFHGLSNEIPLNLKNVKSVVTIHDVIFLRYPELYSIVDRQIYKYKFQKSCERADKVIAISKQTASDIEEFFNIPSDKIEVVYQSCSYRFYKKYSDELRAEIRTKYNLPKHYLLYTGTVEERKNLLLVIQAMNILNDSNIKLVVIGKPTSYIKKVNEYIEKYNLQNSVMYLGHVPFDDLPVIYQCSRVFVYPSIFEGLGIPVLEAISLGVPAITSNVSSLPEAGGDAAMYVDPYSAEEMAEAIKKVFYDEELRIEMIKKGHNFADKFKIENITPQVISLYKSLI